MEETKIILGCQKNDSEAQKVLYELYLPYILTIVRRFGFSDSEVPDIIQEVFIEIFISIQKFNPRKGTLKYWLKSIAIHKILNVNRFKQTKNKVIHLEDVSPEYASTEIALDQLEIEYLVDLIAELPEGYRTVFNLYVVDGYSHEEISQMLNINKASSRSQLSRAKQILKRKIMTLTQTNSYEPI